jgi:putative heme-binding domain-containing protein
VAGVNVEDAKTELRAMMQRPTVEKLRALWTMHAVGQTDAAALRELMLDEGANEHERAWALRLLTDAWPLDTAAGQRPARAGEVKRPGEDYRKEAAALAPVLAKMASREKSALMRLILASTLQRLPVELRAEVASGLVSHAEDANDHNLPLMIWYGLIPVAESDPEALAKVGAQCQLPLTRKYIARRVAEDLETKPEPVNTLLQLTSTATAPEVVAGISEALTGWRKATKPAAWDAFVARLGTIKADALRDLNVVFGDGRALDEVQKVALDEKADLQQRKAALQTLIDSRPPNLREVCGKLLKVRFLNPVAAKGLATIDDPAIGEELVAAYRNFHMSERAQLMATLVSRPAFAKALLAAVAKNKIPRTEISAFDARQIRSFNDATLTQTLNDVWGESRESAADKKQAIAEWKSKLTPEVRVKADLLAGRTVFSQVCAVCHTLYGEGGKIGPDLTGAGRENLDYLLENIVDPSAVVSADFRMTIATLKDGRVLSGMVRNETPRTLGIQTMTELATVERAEIANLVEMPQSLMPEGLFSALNETQVRDLIGYLMHRGQVGQ